MEACEDVEDLMERKKWKETELLDDRKIGYTFTQSVSLSRVPRV